MVVVVVVVEMGLVVDAPDAPDAPDVVVVVVELACTKDKEGKGR